MKIVVFSDSHGNTENMRQVIQQEQPNAVFFLGDGRRDILSVMGDYPELLLFSVSGNCDWRSKQETTRLVMLEDVRFFLAHGHTFDVKNGYETYLQYGHKRNVDVLLSGHTHLSCIWEDNGVLLMNPGAVGFSSCPTYGVLEAKQGKLLLSEIREVPNPVYP